MGSERKDPARPRLHQCKLPLGSVAGLCEILVQFIDKKIDRALFLARARTRRIHMAPTPSKRGGRCRTAVLQTRNLACVMQCVRGSLNGRLQRQGNEGYALDFGST